jgi:hypothetical protein
MSRQAAREQAAGVVTARAERPLSRALPRGLVLAARIGSWALRLRAPAPQGLGRALGAQGGPAYRRARPPWAATRTPGASPESAACSCDERRAVLGHVKMAQARASLGAPPWGWGQGSAPIGGPGRARARVEALRGPEPEAGGGQVLETVDTLIGFQGRGMGGGRLLRPSQGPTPGQESTVQGNLQHLRAAGQGSLTGRDRRGPDSIAGPSCQATDGSKRGCDDPAPARQRSEWHAWDQRVDDWTAPLWAGHHHPLTGWGLWRYGRGLHVAHAPRAQAWAIPTRAAEPMTPALRGGLVNTSQP